MAVVAVVVVDLGVGEAMSNIAADLGVWLKPKQDTYTQVEYF